MTYKTINSIVVDCSDWGFGDFNVLVVYDEKLSEFYSKDGKDGYYFYLRHPQYAPVMDMFGSSADSLEDAAELAYYNAPDYIPGYIEDIFDYDDCDCDDCYEVAMVENEWGHAFTFDQAANLMDDELCLKIHNTFPTLDHQEFFDIYCKAHEEKFGEEFELAKENLVW